MAARARLLRALLGVGIAALCIALAVSVAPLFAGPAVSRVLSAWTGVAVRVGWLSWNPLAGALTLHGVALAPAPETPPLVTCEAIRIDLSVRRWLAGTWVLDELVVRRPWVDLTRGSDGDFALMTLVRPAAVRPEQAPAADGGYPVVTLRTLRIDGGSIQFRDETTTPTLETSLHLDDIRTHDLQFSLGGRADLALRLTSTVEGEPLDVALTYRATATDSDLMARLTIDNVSLARTLVYVPLGWQRVSGRVDVALTYHRRVEAGALHTHRLEAKAVLREVSLAEPWSPEHTVRVAEARLDGVRVDFMERHTNLGAIAAGDYTLLVMRDAAGLRIPFVAPSTTVPSSGWRTTLGTIALGPGRIMFRNVVPGGAPELEAAVRAGTIRPSKGGLSLAADLTLAGGDVALRGTSRDGRTHLTLTLDAVSLAELAPELGLPIAFSDGRVDGTVVATFGTDAPQIRGTLAIPRAKSIPPDPAHPEEVLAWHDLTLDIAAVSFEPLQVHVRQARAAWPYLMIHRGPRGLYPMTYGRAQPDAPEPGTLPSPAPSPEPALIVDRAVVHGGRVEFYDTTLTPPYWTALADIDATFESLRLAPLNLGRFEIAGALDELSPARASGSVDAAVLRARAALEQVRLVPLNPYLEPALGYEINSGVARIDSTLTLDASELKAANDVVLSRFALTGSGDDFFRRRLGVPLTLALALMKDRRGDISLHLPVRGDLQAGEYELGAVVLSALREALAGAVRTPVRLLGSVLRGDEEERFDLRPIPFPVGSAALDPEGEARIAQIARVLARHRALHVVLLPEPSADDAQRLGDAMTIEQLAGSSTRTATEQALLEFLRARHAGDAPAPPVAEIASALHELETARGTPVEGLAALTGARTAAVTRHLVERHGLDAGRIRVRSWKRAAPRPGSVPGVDVQLRSD